MNRSEEVDDRLFLLPSFGPVTVRQNVHSPFCSQFSRLNNAFIFYLFTSRLVHYTIISSVYAHNFFNKKKKKLFMQIYLIKLKQTTLNKYEESN